MGSQRRSESGFVTPTDDYVSARRRKRKGHRRHHPHVRRLTLEPLEDRIVLAAALTFAPSLLGTLAGLIDPQAESTPFDFLPEPIRPNNIIETIFEPLPQQVRDETLGIVNQLIDLADAATVYHAFPGETNNVEITSDFANLVLLINESSDVTLFNMGIGAIPPVAVDTVLKAIVPDAGFGINIGGSAGPLVVFGEAAGKADLTITGEQIRSVLKSFINFSSARTAVINPSALFDFIPSAGRIVDVATNILNFDVRDILNPIVDIDPIIDIDLPFGLPDIEIPPDIARGILDIVDQTGLPTSFGELIEQLPGEVGSIVSIVTDTLDFLTGELLSDRIFISTLDRPDRISFPNLTGIPVTVYAGTGPDTIEAGGGASIVDSILDPFDIVDLGQLFDDNAEIELFGQGGTDTFILNRLFNSLATTIDGGPGDDQLVLRGTGQADIIEIEADANGVLREVRFFVPDPNGDTDTDEVQRVTLPTGTTGGDFTLTFVNDQNQSDTTAPITFGAAPGLVAAELAALSNIPNASDVSVAVEPDGSYTITFTNALGFANQRLLQANGINLTRSGPNVSVQEVQAGDPDVGINQIQRIDLPPNVISSDPNETPYLSGGTFTLTLDDGLGNLQPTIPLPHNATASVVGEALNDALQGLALPTGSIDVSGSPGGPWDVEYIGDLDGVALVPLLPNQPQITVADGTLLTGGVTSTTSQTTPGNPLGVVITLPPAAAIPAPPVGALGGSFVLTVGAETTRPLRFNASAIEVQNALEELGAANNVNASGPVGGPWTVFLSGSGAAGGVTGDPAELTGGIVPAVTDTTIGFSVNEVQRVTVTADDGDFMLTFDNGTVSRETGPIAFDATAQELQTALENLGSIGGPNNVLVTEFSRSATAVAWDVLFTGDLSGINLDPTTFDDTGLIGVGAGITVSEETAGAAGVNETQDITFAPVPTGGDYRLTFLGETTPEIPFNASAAQLRTLLETLGAIDPGDIEVTLIAGGHSIEFVGRKAGMDFAAIEVNPLELSGGFGPTDIMFGATAPPSAAVNEVQQITFDPITIGGATLPRVDGGTYQLGFDGEFTGDLPFNAAPAVVEDALEALATIGAGNVSVGGVAGNLTVTFIGDKAANNVRSIVVNTSQLTRDEPIEIDLIQEAALTNEIQRFGLPSQVSGGTFTLSFQSMMALETVAGGGGVNEEQTIMLPAGTTGGTFQLTLANSRTVDLPSNATVAQVQAALGNLPTVGGEENVMVTTPGAGQWDIEFIGSLSDTNVPLIETDGENLVGPFTTVPIDFDASANDVQTALQDLVSLGGGLANNVQVAVPEIDIEQTVRGRTAVNEIQSIILPDNTTGGTFTLTFQGQPTGNIDFDATAAEVETALDLLPLAGFDVAVTGNMGGPWSVAFSGASVTGIDVELMTASALDLNLAGGDWTIEFIEDFAGKSLESLVIDASLVTTSGLGDPSVTTISHGGNGDPILISTKRFDTFVDVEHLRIEGGDGDDTLRIFGPPEFSLGIMFDAGGGTDVLELISDDVTPEFDSPVFPGDDIAIVFVDGQAVQFADMEGELIYDADNAVGSAALSGTFAGNEIRLNVMSADRATFANDGQVTTTLRNFAPGSSVTLRGEQGEDTISVQLNGITNFSNITIDGGGPVGADSIRFEGTGGNDAFTHTPAATIEEGFVTLGTVMFEYLDILDISFVGLGGVDSLLVNEALADSNDLVLFFPQAGNDGTYQYTRRTNGATSELVYPTVAFTSIENRNFDTGGGVDTFQISSDDLPGVNSSASVTGGSGVTDVAFGDQSVIFTHDITNAADFFSFEIGTADDIVDVTPGEGISLVINTALGNDLLNYFGNLADITLDVVTSAINQTGLGPVSFTNAETVHFDGNGLNALAVLGSALENRYVYTPLTANGGRFTSDQAYADYTFSDIGGPFTLGGGVSPRDTVIVEGSSGSDAVLVDGSNRTVAVQDPAGTDLQPVTLNANVETTGVHSGEGDDQVGVQPAAGLFVHVDTGPPNASDRIFVEDMGPGDLVIHREGPDRRSGSVVVGALAPVDYINTERVEIIPLDPITSGTGADGAGRLLVFDDDPFEHNESLQTGTRFTAVDDVLVRPTIDPGIGQFPNGPLLPADEDWYQFRAPKIGTFSFEVLYARIGTLTNGNAGLPSSGELLASVYRTDGTLIADSVDFADGDVVSFSADRLEDYYLRVRGVAQDVINVYDISLVEVDLLGPQVIDPDGAGPLQPIQVGGAPDFNLFDLKGAAGQLQGPTPPVNSIVINLWDLLNREDHLPADLFNRPVPNGRAPGDLYSALDALVADQLGHFEIRGDQNGIVPIASVNIVQSVPIAGQIPTATVELVFAEPLADDRFTLTIRDSLIDPPGNGFDGNSNAAEPNGNPTLPSGDGVAGGDFVARFTVDSRAEIGIWAAGSIYIDTNGNNTFDPEAVRSDDTNEDIVYTLGFTTDNVFAGNFVAGVADLADGFDKVAAYGRVAGSFRWLVDVNNDSVIDLVVADPMQQNGLPVAGNFDGDLANGDEVGLKNDVDWFLDTDHDFMVDTTLNGDMVGYPFVGDFDGDGVDDLGAWADDMFRLDLSGDGIDGFMDREFRLGFPGPRERPVAADFDADGHDDIGLWAPDRSGAVPAETAEWYVLISGGAPIVDRIVANPDLLGGDYIPFTPDPFGSDVFARFGDDFALPVVGNFDPPVTARQVSTTYLSTTNPRDALDVNADGFTSPVDALWIINEINGRGSGPLGQVVVALDYEELSAGAYLDTSGDRYLSPLDTLIVINFLNDQSVIAAEAEAGGQAAQPLVRWSVPPSPTLLISPAVERQHEQSPADFENDEFSPWQIGETTPAPTRSGSIAAGDELDALLDQLADDVTEAWQTLIEH